MASVDQVLDDGKYRIPTDKLTESERQQLEEQGFEIDGRDFVDLDIGQPKPATDPKQEKRKEAEKELMAAVNRPPAAAAAPPSNDQIKRLKDRVAELEKQLQEVPQACNRCDWPTGAKVEVEPTKDDLKDFLRSVMGGEVYTKTYGLFDNNIRVCFRTRTGVEEQQIKATLRERLNSGQIVNSADLVSTSRQLNFACSLQSFSSPLVQLEFAPDLVNQETLEADPAFLSLAQLRVNKLPSQMQQMLLRQFDLFSELVELLLAKATDQDFWKGTANLVS